MARYRDRPELGRGSVELLDVGRPAVLAHRSTWAGRTTVALHDLGEEPVTVRLPADVVPAGRRVLDLFGLEEHGGADDGGLEVTLGRYGYRWLGDVVD